MAQVYNAYRTPFSSISWLPKDADVPYFGVLLGTCTDTVGCKYQLQAGISLADFLRAIPLAPWQLLDGRRQAEVEITVPPCESVGRTAETVKIFTVRGEKYKGLSGFLQKWVGGPLLAFGISLIVLLPLQFLAGLVGTAVLGPLFGAMDITLGATALTLLGGLLIGALTVLLALLIQLLYWRSGAEQGTVRYR
ncbi:MAG: hypothetical protein LBB14_02180 [Puniceicoccales bacterium]|jgi:hypothetical protein|nr:hypothetical protein [Puniceicoccales bacterium]